MSAAVVEDRATDAFQDLITPLLDPAYRLATSLLHDRDEAEDAVQEAAIKAWRGLPRLRDPQRARAWFLAIVVNECRMALRRPWWKVIRQAVVPERPAQPTDSTVSSLDLARGLAALPAEDRAALFLYYWLDLPLQEVAGATGASLGATKSRIYRAARRLRPDLAEEEAFAR